MSSFLTILHLNLFHQWDTNTWLRQVLQTDHAAAFHFNIWLGAYLRKPPQTGQKELNDPTATLHSSNNLHIRLYRDFPGGPVIKNPPSNAVDLGSIPGQGTKIPHASGQVSLHAATTKPAHPGAHTPQLERSLSAVTREVREPQWKIPHAATKIPHATTKTCRRDFPGGAAVKNLPANAGDMGSIPGLGRSHMPWSN